MDIPDGTNGNYLVTFSFFRFIGCFFYSLIFFSTFLFFFFFFFGLGLFSAAQTHNTSTTSAPPYRSRSILAKGSWLITTLLTRPVRRRDGARGPPSARLQLRLASAWRRAAARPSRVSKAPERELTSPLSPRVSLNVTRKANGKVAALAEKTHNGVGRTRGQL